MESATSERHLRGLLLAIWPYRRSTTESVPKKLSNQVVHASYIGGISFGRDINIYWLSKWQLSDRDVEGKRLDN